MKESIIQTWYKDGKLLGNKGGFYVDGLLPDTNGEWVSVTIKLNKIR